MLGPDMGTAYLGDGSRNIPGSWALDQSYWNLVLTCQDVFWSQEDQFSDQGVLLAIVTTTLKMSESVAIKIKLSNTTTQI